jgi:hypothetical protein
MSEPSGAGLGGVSSVIGRYFAVVSFMPSLLLVSWLLLLTGTGAWTGPPDWSRSVRSLTDLTVSGVVVFLLVALAVAALLHPLQFAVVQVLEGYWGTSTFAMRLRALRTEAYVRRRARLKKLATDAFDGETVVARVAFAEADHEVLRRHEYDAGHEYALPVLTFAGQLAHVAPPEQVRYVNDQRTALDLAVKCCLVGLLGTLATVVFLWQHGLWLIVAVVPYSVAYGSYRGAVVVAHGYGQALEDLVALNRFALYERLHLPMPPTTDAERENNTTLLALTADHNPEKSLTYEHPVLQPAHDCHCQRPPEPTA